MKFILSGAFGELSPVREGAHNGIDIAMETGTTLRALTDGVVYAIRDYGDKNIGKGVVIKSDDGNFHIFGHMSKISVTKGQTVNGGEIIGLSGNSGHSTGSHLHFGVQQPNGEFINPSEYIEPLMAISGDVQPIEIVNVVNSIEQQTGFGKWALENYNDFSAWVIDKEVEFILKPIVWAMTELSITVWEWIIENLPDIMGYATVLTAICMIISAMVGRGMIKPFSIYAAFMILSLCILGGV